MTINEAWEQIAQALLDDGWKLPNNHTLQTWPRALKDTCGSAIPTLEKLIIEFEPHIGMI